MNIPLKTTTLTLAGELWQDLRSGKAVSAVAVGTTAAFFLLMTHIAYATYVFSGSLAPHFFEGASMFLFGACAACLIATLTSTYRGMIAGLSSTLAVAMATVSAAIQTTDSSHFITVAMTLMLCASCIGILCLVLGHYGLANLLRFIPYPVGLGFVAGLGGKVTLASLRLMVDEFNWHSLHTLFELETLWRWVPGIALGGILYWLMKRWSNILILPIVVCVAVVAFYVSLSVFDISLAEARTGGLLLTEVAQSSQWPTMGFNDLSSVDWAAIASQLPNIFVLSAIAVIAIPMYLAGLEVAIKEDLDWNREFKAFGLASTVAGLVGGVIAITKVSSSVRSKTFGANSRLSGIVAAVALALVLFLGSGLLAFLPTLIVGGILLFSGLGMLHRGIVEGYRLLPPIDYAIIILIFATIQGFGLLEGLGVGLLATLISFAVRLSRVDPVESHTSAEEVRSSKARPVPERVILQEEGTYLKVYRLQGYIFFGSVSQLASHLRELVHSDNPPLCMMLDFTAVSGIDYSAVHVLTRVFETANRSNIQVVVGAVPNHVLHLIKRNLPESAFANLIVEDNEDQALERSEDIVIAAWKADAEDVQKLRSALLTRTAARIEQHLERQIEFEDLVEELRGWLSTREYAVGDALFDVTMQHDELLLLTDGLASSYDASGKRLAQFSRGDSIESLDSREQGVHSVVADQPCTALAFNPVNQERLEEQQPELALRLYRYLLPDWSRSVHEDKAGKNNGVLSR